MTNRKNWVSSASRYQDQPSTFKLGATVLVLWCSIHVSRLQGFRCLSTFWLKICTPTWFKCQTSSRSTFFCHLNGHLSQQFPRWLTTYSNVRKYVVLTIVLICLFYHYLINHWKYWAITRSVRQRIVANIIERSFCLRADLTRNNGQWYGCSVLDNCLTASKMFQYYHRTRTSVNFCSWQPLCSTQMWPIVDLLWGIRYLPEKRCTANYHDHPHVLCCRYLRNWAPGKNTIYDAIKTITGNSFCKIRESIPSSMIHWLKLHWRRFKEKTEKFIQDFGKTVVATTQSS